LILQDTARLVSQADGRDAFVEFVCRSIVGLFSGISADSVFRMAETLDEPQKSRT